MKTEGGTELRKDAQPLRDDEKSKEDQKKSGGKDGT
jgi:hypothetical protein